MSKINSTVQPEHGPTKINMVEVGTGNTLDNSQIEVKFKLLLKW